MKPQQIHFITERPYVALGLASLTLLSACTTTAPQADLTSSLERPLPENWQSTSPEVSNSEAAPEELSDWWHRFGDPELDRLIEIALAQNTDTQAALSTIRRSRAARGVTEGGFWPSLTGGVGAGSSHSEGLDGNTSSSSENFSASLDASWEIDLFGQQRSGLTAADANLASTVELYGNARVSLAAEVANTYISLLALDAQEERFIASLFLREKNLQIAQWQEQSGEGDQLSVAQLTTDIEQTRSSLPDISQNITETLNSLAVLTGQTPQELRSFLDQADELPSFPARISVGIPAETLKQRPDISASLYQLTAAEAELTGAKRSRLPSLRLSGSISLAEGDASDLFDPQQLLSNIAASLSAPIWQAGAITNQIKIEEEDLTQAYLSFERTVLEALSEVENALSAIQNRSEKLNALQRAEVSAKQSAQLAQQQYDAGEVDLLTLLDAQRSELSTQISRISTQADTLTAHIQLYKALGGGWNPSNDLPEAL